MKEFENTPILHLTDFETSFSASIFLDSREMNLAAKTFEHSWCNLHVPPAIHSADFEFSRNAFPDALKAFCGYMREMTGTAAQ